MHKKTTKTGIALTSRGPLLASPVWGLCVSPRQCVLVWICGRVSCKCSSRLAVLRKRRRLCRADEIKSFGSVVFLCSQFSMKFKGTSNLLLHA